MTSPSKTTVRCRVPAAHRAGDATVAGPPIPEENQDPMFTISAFVDALTLEEVSEVMSISLATVERDLKFSRSWLNNQLSPAGGNSPL